MDGIQLLLRPVPENFLVIEVGIFGATGCQILIPKCMKFNFC